MPVSRHPWRGSSRPTGEPPCRSDGSAPAPFPRGSETGSCPRPDRLGTSPWDDRNPSVSLGRRQPRGPPLRPGGTHPLRVAGCFGRWDRGESPRSPGSVPELAKGLTHSAGCRGRGAAPDRSGPIGPPAPAALDRGGDPTSGGHVLGQTAAVAAESPRVRLVT